MQKKKLLAKENLGGLLNIEMLLTVFQKYLKWLVTGSV